MQIIGAVHTLQTMQPDDLSGHRKKSEFHQPQLLQLLVKRVWQLVKVERQLGFLMLLLNCFCI